MADSTIVNLSRRRFVVGGLAIGTGLTLGLQLPARGQMGAGPGKAGEAIATSGGFEPNAFVRIDADDTVTVISKHLEMGQGAFTGMATLVAEELDARWDQVRVEGAPADAGRYNNLFWGPFQGTGGSTAMANSYEQMRKAGAAARAMLVAAAARQWQVPAGEISVRDGVLSHASGKRAQFGALAAAAAAEAVPEEVFIKDPEEFRLIGTRLPRKDGRSKTDGTARFTQDVQLPGMLTAVVLHPPRFGARLKSVDGAAALKVSGVEQVIEIPSGVAVLARDFWSARQGREALRVTWDETGAMTQGSTEIEAEYRELAKRPGLVARRDGDPEAALQGSATTIEAEYVFPYLAHAALEPMNCVVQIGADGCEIWNGEQLQTGDQMAVAGLLGMEPERVRLNMLFAGGSFGRRANPKSDYVLEAVHIAKAAGTEAPVKLIWTREDDTQAGWYRPLYLHKLRAGLDAQGRPTAWTHRIVGQSIIAGTAFEQALVKDGIDETSVEGAKNLPYELPNLLVDLHSPVNPVPVQWWRAVGSTHTAFAVETFLDELAAQAGKDPVEFRRALLAGHPRHRAVLDLAVAESDWGKALPPGKGRGVAVHESFNSYVAMVVDVSVEDGGRYTVDRVVIAVDCGVAVNPDVVVAQMEGGMGFGLAATMASEIRISAGAAVQSNFHDYEVLRMNQMPKRVDVHIVKSGEAPTGVGEPATPVIAPAVANALHAVTGKRYHRLPLRSAT